MDSIIETQRALHEEIDRYEQALADVLMQTPTVQRNIVRRDRKAAEIIDKITSLRSSLVSMYEDVPALRPKEIALLSAPAPGQDDLAEFYTRFEKIKDFHRANPQVNARTFLNEIDELVRSDGLQTIYVEDEEEPVIIDPLDSVFSGEEAYGKRMDLFEAHTKYLNLRGANRLSYIAFLDMLRKGFVEKTLDNKERGSPAYLDYVQTIYNYLVSFFDRALPLLNVQSKIKEEEENFASQWEAGQWSGWQSGSGKTETPSEGIWCQYCQKTYSKQTVYDAHLTSAKHKKKVAAGLVAPNPTSSTASPVASSSTAKDKLRPAARLTYLTGTLLTFPPIPELLANSRSEVERRAALTAREREAEMEEQEEAPIEQEPVKKNGNGEDKGAESDEDDGHVYNPLNLPLGWDGKPIPYWLYKLHGLGVQQSCEICGGAVYAGRRAFERHFTESRHAQGLKSLGLPNTRHWQDITTVKDALLLGEKMKREGRNEMANAAKAVEMEDSEGNVYSLADYTALSKQGLIS